MSERSLTQVTGAGFGDQNVQDAVSRVKQQLRMQKRRSIGCSLPARMVHTCGG